MFACGISRWNLEKRLIHTLHKKIFSLLCVLACAFSNWNALRTQIRRLHNKIVFLQWVIASVFSNWNLLKMLIHRLYENFFSSMCVFKLEHSSVSISISVLDFKLCQNTDLHCGEMIGFTGVSFLNHLLKYELRENNHVLKCNTKNRKIFLVRCQYADQYT